MLSLYLLFGSLFSPIIGIVALLCNLKKYIPSRVTTILLSFIISLIGIYWFPWGDVQTHFYTYSMDFVELYFNFSSASLLSSYWIYDIVVYIIAEITGNYVFGYMFWLFVPLTIFTWAVWDKYLKNRNKEKYVILFILLFSMIGVREFLDLNRSTASILFLVSGIILQEKKKYGNFFFILLFAISCLLHDMSKIFIILLPLFIILTKYVRNHKTWLIIAFLLIGLSTIIRIYVLPLMMSDRNAELYLSGVWGTGSGVASGFMLICGWLNILMLIILFLFLVKNINNINNRLLLSLFLASSVICFACFGLWTIRERFAILAIISGCSILITEWEHIGYKKYIATKTVLFTIAIRFILILLLHYSALYVHNTSSNNPQKTVQITSRVLYVPTVFLFDVENLGYSDQMYNKLYDRAKYGK